MSVEGDAVALNRAHWDEQAAIQSRDADGSQRVTEFKNGADLLSPIEASEIGEVRGKRVLHLQCHLGLETLSLARRGAIVTGIDFSTRALAFARALRDECGLTGTFVTGDVRAVRTLVEGGYDVVYAAWGVLNWVPDVRPWAVNAASLLRRGGRLYVADYHPVALQMEERADASGTMRLMAAEGWRTTPDKPIAHADSREWIHPLSEVLAAVADAGLELELLHEHEATTWRHFRSLRRGADGLWRMPPGRPRVPLAFSLSAIRV